jgi:hypothetical protein
MSRKRRKNGRKKDTGEEESGKYGASASVTADVRMVRAEIFASVWVWIVIKIHCLRLIHVRKGDLLDVAMKAEEAG